MKRHANIPIFIPHLGCPNQCVFCNQRHISGVERFDPSSVIPIIDEALSTIGGDREVEIAFFGGSFTGIDRELMVNLLQIANKYIQSGAVSAIRCSTRPDYINDEILDILEKYGVKTIELGLQSASDTVLSASKRGHTRADELYACNLIRERGFSLVGQMMIGLPSATPESELETARFIADMKATAARIYPTVVFRDTELCNMAFCGEYTPLTVEDAVERTAKPLQLLLSSGVEVIRIGLCASENLTSDTAYFAGPNHPALGELVISRLYYLNIREALASVDTAEKSLVIYVSQGALSKAIGQRRTNKFRLIQEFGLADVEFRECSTLKGYEFKLEFEGDI